MKIAVFGPNRRVGVVDEASVVDVNGAYAKYLTEPSDSVRPAARRGGRRCPPSSMPSSSRGTTHSTVPARHWTILSAGTATRPWCRRRTARASPWTKSTLHAPIEGQSRIFAALANFADHMQSARRQHREASERQGNPRPAALGRSEVLHEGPAMSSPPTVTRCATRRAPSCSTTRRRSAVVIGKRGRDIAADDFGSYIWGYTLVNDWSIRDNVSIRPGLQYSKNFDTSAAVGPWIVVDESLDPQNIPVECTRQRRGPPEREHPVDDPQLRLARGVPVQATPRCSPGT